MSAIEERVAEVMAAAPPMTDQHAERVAWLLRGLGIGDPLPAEFHAQQEPAPSREWDDTPCAICGVPVAGHGWLEHEFVR
jgi:hypothetical protein